MVLVGESDKPLESLLDNTRTSQDRAQEIYSGLPFIQGRAKHKKDRKLNNCIGKI